MPFDILLVAVVALIAIFLVAIRTNSAVVFFSVCAGSVLANQLGGEATLLSSTVIKDGDLNNSVIYIALIILPAILSAIFLRGSISSSKFVFNFIPSLAVGGLIVLLVVPLLPGGVREQLVNNQAWDLIEQFQPIVLVGGVISSVALLWLTHDRKKGKKKHK